MYSQLSPCGHLTIKDTHYYRQNSDPHLKRFDWKWLPVLWTLAIPDTEQRPKGVRYNGSWLYISTVPATWASWSSSFSSFNLTLSCRNRYEWKCNIFNKLKKKIFSDLNIF